jgi:outer membrane immunogenic protein
MKAGIGATLALGLLSSSVMAAGSGPWAPTTVKDAPLPDFIPAYSWTGIYLGMQGGSGWGEVNFDNGGGVTVSGPQRQGWFGGGFAGFNLQLNPVVVGVEADANGGNTDVDSFVSVRGRVGLAADRLLFFTTGGWAWADVSGTLVAPDLSRSTFDATLEGWTMGGGLDYAFTDKFIGRIEYRHYALEDTRLDTVAAGLALKF